MRNDIDTTRVLLNMQVDVNSTNVSERFVPPQGRSNLVDAARPPLSASIKLPSAVVFEARIKEYFLLEEACTSSFSTRFPSISQMSGATPLSCAVGGVGGSEGACAALLRASGARLRLVEDTISPGSIIDVPLRRPRRAIDDRAENMGRMVYTGQF